MKLKKSWVIFLILFICLQQYATFYAPGITYDSRQYISATHSFLESGILLNEDGSYYVEYAPLYPIILSVGIDHVLKWASILNMCCLIAALWIMFLLGEQLIHHSVSQWLYQGSLALGTPILLVGSFVWSEPIFILLLSFLWYLLYQYHRHPSTQSIGWLILMTNLLCLQRNAGIFFFLIVLLVIILKQQKKHILLYGTLGGISFFVWNMYAYAITRGGHNIADQDYFFGFMNDFLENFPTLASWFFPGNWRILLFAILIIGVTVFIHRLHNKSRWTPLQISIICFIPCICLIYFAFIAAIWWKLARWDVERYISVIYPLVMLAAFMVWDKLFAEVTNKKLKTVLLILSFLWLCYPIARTVKNAVFWHEVNKSKIVIKHRESSLRQP